MGLRLYSLERDIIFMGVIFYKAFVTLTITYYLLFTIYYLLLKHHVSWIEKEYNQII